VNDYKKDLLSDLQSDPAYAQEYLEAACAESPDAFLVALKDVADSQKGMKKVAIDAGVNRENLYRMLSEDGNPRLRNLTSVLEALGFRISVTRIGGRQSPGHPGSERNRSVQGMHSVPTKSGRRA